MTSPIEPPGDMPPPSPDWTTSRARRSRPNPLGSRILQMVILLAVVLVIVVVLLYPRKPPAVTSGLIGTPTPAFGGGALSPTQPVAPVPTLAASPVAVGTVAPPANPTTVTTAPTITIGAYVQVANLPAGEKLRFRTGPGLNFTTSRLVDEGTVLLVMEGPQQADNYNWWRLQDQQGNIGWAAGEFLKPAPPPR